MATPKKNAKNSKSTKTAHVLNLITSPQKKQEEKEKQAQASSTAEVESLEAAAVPRRHLMPPILEVTRINDEEASDQIRLALESELEEEAASQQTNDAPFSLPAEREASSAVDSVSDIISNLMPPQERSIPADEPVAAVPPSPAADMQEQGHQAEADTVSVEKAAPVQAPVTAAAESVEKQEELPGQEQEPQPTAPITISAEESAPAKAPITAEAESVEKHEELPQPEQEPQPQTAEPIVKPAEEAAPVVVTEAHEEPVSAEATPEKSVSEPVYTNLTQVLVEKRAPHYMKMFKLCDCPRCAADVKALTLTRLEPKYVISKKNESIPMLKTHEREYGGQVNAQLIRACRTVKEHPHHG